MAGVLSLYLIRHAPAEERGAQWPDDRERPLTERGRRRFASAASGFVALEGAPEVILTSPLVRARQTADVLARAAKCANVHDVEALAPDHDPAEAFSVIRRHRQATKLVVIGHEPDLGALAAYALDTASCLTFKKGGACRIDLPRGRVHGVPRLVWFLPPAVLRELAK